MFDSHTHILDPKFVGYEEEYIKNAEKVGVNGFMCIGLNNANTLECINLAKKHSNVFVSAGYFPLDVNELEDAETLSLFNKIVEENKDYVKAIGETGLDFYYEKDESKRNQQKKWFIYSIELANKNHLPVMVHMRNATQETYNILQEHTPLYGTILHCYNGSVEMTKLFIKLGCYFSIGGIITFNNIGDLIESIKIIPLEKLLLETDAPYLSPAPYRGKRNESSYMIEVLKKVSEIHEISVDLLDKITTHNSSVVFHVKYE
ncbi:MAG: TatD family hydrolase [Bacilli bacterium]